MILAVACSCLLCVRSQEAASNTGGWGNRVEVCTLLWLPELAEYCEENQNWERRLSLFGSHGMPFR